MKKVIDNIGTDIDCVSVDSTAVRELLEEDDQYNIDTVPTVLLIYSSGQHKTHIGKSLDQWFEQLLDNIKTYQVQMQQEMAMNPQLQQQEMATNPQLLQQFEPEIEYTPIDDNVPKALRRKPGIGNSIPSSLPSPGRPQLGGGGDPQEYVTGISSGSSGMGGGTQLTGVGGISSAQAAMVTEHIRGAEPSVPINIDHLKPVRKEVKKEGLSAAELAKQMAQQREQHDESLEQDRPFM